MKTIALPATWSIESWMKLNNVISKADNINNNQATRHTHRRALISNFAKKTTKKPPI